MRGADEHHWEWADDVVVLYVRRYGIDDIGYTENDICRLLGLKESALHYRKENFGALEGAGAFENAAKLTRCVHAALKDSPREFHRAQVRGILDWKAAARRRAK